LALHFTGGLLPSQNKYTLPFAVTDSDGGLTLAPLMLHLPGVPLSFAAEIHVTCAPADNLTSAGCIRPSASVVAVIVWEEEEDLQPASTMARNIIVIENRTSFPFGGARRASLRNSKMEAGELKNTASAMEVKLMFETVSTSAQS
jgi:hypothetical protein